MTPEPQSAEDVARSHHRHRATLRNAVVNALCPIYGGDNVSLFEDDPWLIGICFDDGDFVTLQIDG